LVWHLFTVKMVFVAVSRPARLITFTFHIITNTQRL
jgi:hypothetical protein